MPGRGRYLSFPGQVVYAGTAAAVESACCQLLEAVEALPPMRKLVLGFDMEWQFKPQELAPALIQLCWRASSSHAHPPPTLSASARSQEQQLLLPSILVVSQPPLDSARQQNCMPLLAPHTQLPCEPQPQGPTDSRTPHAPDQAQADSHESVQDPGMVCVVLHLARLGAAWQDRAHPRLKQLLEHPRVFVVTCGDRDEAKLRDDLRIQPSNLEQVNMMHFLLRQEQAAAGGACPVNRCPKTPAALPPERRPAAQPEQASAAAAPAPAAASLTAKDRAALALQAVRQQAEQKRAKRRRRQLAPHHHVSLEDGGVKAGGTASEDELAGPVERVSLAALVGEYLGLRLDKRSQREDGGQQWEADCLAAKHLQYAATDAYAQLLVFEEIKSKLQPLLKHTREAC